MTSYPFHCVEQLIRLHSVFDRIVFVKAFLILKSHAWRPSNVELMNSSHPWPLGNELLKPFCDMQLATRIWKSYKFYVFF